MEYVSYTDGKIPSVKLLNLVVRPLLVRFDEYGFEILSLNRFIHLSVYVILMLDLAELFGKRADAISISISLPFTGRKNEKKILLDSSQLNSLIFYL
jgi:hypothetical protein